MPYFRLPDDTRIVILDDLDPEPPTQAELEAAADLPDDDAAAEQLWVAGAEVSWPDLTTELVEFEPGGEIRGPMRREFEAYLQVSHEVQPIVSQTRPGPRERTGDYHHGALWSLEQMRAAQGLPPMADSEPPVDQAERDRHRAERRARTTPELLARLDSVLGDASAGQTAGDLATGSDWADARRLEIDQHNGGLLPTGPQPDLPHVDNPIRRGPHDTTWMDVAEQAWADLTGETELPEWFDDLATIGEVARRSGHTRAEVKAAIDHARYGRRRAYGEYPGPPPIMWYQDTQLRRELDRIALMLEAFEAGRRFSDELSRISAAVESIDASEWLAALAADLGTDVTENIDGSRSIDFDVPDIAEVTATIRRLTDRLHNAEEVALSAEGSAARVTYPRSTSRPWPPGRRRSI